MIIIGLMLLLVLQSSTCVIYKEFYNDIKFSSFESTIAIIDSGLTSSLLNQYDDRIIKTYNAIDNTNDVKDSVGHGSEVFCIIACNYEISSVEGVNPTASFIIIKVTNSKNVDIAPLKKAIQYALEWNPDIINISISGDFYDQEIENLLNQAYLSNIYVITSVGNQRSSRLFFPSNLSSVISVASGNSKSKLSSFTNYSQNVKYIVLGEKILTNNGLNNHQPYYVDGTSYAAAILTGIISKIHHLSSFTILHNSINVYICNRKDLQEFFSNVIN
ncbi:MAG: S8 family serine peptidase [Acholeplasmataceae bacterium]|nr:S8 family serine peptidase [Acholeplasmataceae bacterium]